LPVIITSMLNQDVKAKHVSQYPQLYETGQLDEEFSLSRLVGWISLALFQSLVIFFFGYFLIAQGNYSASGKVFGLWEFGLMAYTALVLIVTLKMSLEVIPWYWANLFVILLSLLVLFLFEIAYSYLSLAVDLAPEQYHVILDLYNTPNFWLYLAVAIIAATIPDITYKFVSRAYYPKSYHIIQEIQKFHIKFKEPPKGVKGKKGLFRTRKRRKNITNFATPKIGDSSSARATGYAFSQEKGQRNWLRRKLRVRKQKRKLKKLNK